MWESAGKCPAWVIISFPCRCLWLQLLWSISLTRTRLWHIEYSTWGWNRLVTSLGTSSPSWTTSHTWLVGPWYSTVLLYPLPMACTLSLYCEIVGIFVLYPKVSCVPPVLCTPLSSCLLSHFVWSVGTFVLCPPVLSFCSPRGQQHSCAVWEISLFYEPWKDKVSVCVCGCGCGCVWVCGCVGVCWLPD